jgi:hypothetical protein
MFSCQVLLMCLLYCRADPASSTHGAARRSRRARDGSHRGLPARKLNSRWNRPVHDVTDLLFAAIFRGHCRPADAPHLARGGLLPP